MQVLLLRALETGELQRVGADRAVHTDVRVVAATSRPLRDEVDAGRFRADLYWRLQVVEIKLPPLRKRLEDIPLLAEFFLKRSWERHRASGPPPALTADTITFLQTRPWRGNVRELRNVLEQATSLVTERECLE